MRNAGGHQCKEKVSGSEKKSSRECVRHSSIKKFLEVSSCIRAKQRQRNVQKNVLHARAKLFLC